MENKRLTTNDAARLIGVSPSSVLQYERTGRLTAERTLSGMRLFDGDEVRRFAAERTLRRARASAA